MRTATSLSLAKNVGKQFHAIQSEWGGIVPCMQPRMQGNEEIIKERTTAADNKTPEPIVAFSRPPPFPPVLGSVIVLSLLDSWTRRDSTEA